MVIDPTTGKVDHAKAYDTYKTSEAFEKFLAQGVDKGKIVVAACKDDCITAISSKVKDFFKAMGSEEIGRCGYRCGFAFIGIAGREGECNEATPLKL